MADGAGSKRRSGSDAERTDPLVERLRPNPSKPPQRVVVLEGLLGDSDHKGFRRLYFTPSLNHYAEFRAEDLVYTEPISPDQPPLRGLDSSRVAIREGAPVDYTRTTTAQPLDEFDLDVRVAASHDPVGGWPGTAPLICHRTLDTCLTLCGGVCDVVTGEATCGTCRTQCHPFTCNTCATECNFCTQLTCETCATQCNQPTCVQTCRTWCNQATCGCETRFTCNKRLTCQC